MSLMDFPKLQSLVQNDSKMRYHLLLELPSEGDSISAATNEREGRGVWWIRANQGHSLKASVPLQNQPLSTLLTCSTIFHLVGSGSRSCPADGVAKGTNGCSRNHPTSMAIYR